MLWLSYSFRPMTDDAHGRPTDDVRRQRRRGAAYLDPVVLDNPHTKLEIDGANRYALRKSLILSLFQSAY